MMPCPGNPPMPGKPKKRGPGVGEVWVSGYPDLMDWESLLIRLLFELWYCWCCRNPAITSWYDKHPIIYWVYIYILGGGVRFSLWCFFNINEIHWNTELCCFTSVFLHVLNYLAINNSIMYSSCHWYGWCFRTPAPVEIYMYISNYRYETCKLQGIYHINWCRISSINSIVGKCWSLCEQGTPRSCVCLVCSMNKIWQQWFENGSKQTKLGTH